MAHSDLVYTFFHPLLRDQEEANIHMRKLKGNARFVSGIDSQAGERSTKSSVSVPVSVILV